MPAAPEHPGPRFLTVAETANLLRVHLQTVYGMAARGGLPTVRIGRALRIDARRLEAQLEGQTNPRPKVARPHDVIRDGQKVL